jgi:hypothetical protein
MIACLNDQFWKPWKQAVETCFKITFQGSSRRIEKVTESQYSRCSGRFWTPGPSKCQQHFYPLDSDFRNVTHKCELQMVWRYSYLNWHSINLRFELDVRDLITVSRRVFVKLNLNLLRLRILSLSEFLKHFITARSLATDSKQEMASEAEL